MRNLESILFKVEVLCPMNVPRRCPDCNGAPHTRKRCPKSIDDLMKNQTENFFVPSTRNFERFNSNYSHRSSNYFYRNQVSSRFEHFHSRNFPDDYRSTNFRSTPNQRQNSTKQIQRSTQDKTKREQCFKCGGYDHRQDNCRQFQISSVQT